MTEHADNPAEKRRVALVTGDRLCTSCGHNLVGHTVEREERYDLLIVRCTECGTVAAVQEYPGLGPWANRIRMAMALAWIVIVVGAIPSTGLLLAGLAYSPLDDAAARFFDSQIEPDAMMETVSSPWFMLSLIGALLAGAMWTLLIWSNRKLGVVLVAVLCGVAALFITTFQQDAIVSWRHTYQRDTFRTFEPMLLTMTAIMTLAFYVGLLVGRPLIRGFIVLMLAPRFRGAFAVLWTVDGRPLPDIRTPPLTPAGDDDDA